MCTTNPWILLCSLGVNERAVREESKACQLKPPSYMNTLYGMVFSSCEISNMSQSNPTVFWRRHPTKNRCLSSHYGHCWNMVSKYGGLNHWHHKLKAESSFSVLWLEVSIFLTYLYNHCWNMVARSRNPTQHSNITVIPRFWKEYNIFSSLFIIIKIH